MKAAAHTRKVFEGAPPAEPERVPVLVLDETIEPRRLLRDPRVFTKRDLVRMLAALGILLVLFSLAAFLIWRRLRIEPLLRPVPHRARPVPATLK